MARKRGRPPATLRDYIDDHDWLALAAEKAPRLCYPEKEMKPVLIAYCRHCPKSTFYLEMPNITKSIGEHVVTTGHQAKVSAIEKSKKITDFAGRLKETPAEFQDKLLLALLRDGLSVEFTKGSFFTDFLLPRFPMFGSIQSVSTLRDNVTRVEMLEDVVLKERLKGQLFWLGVDETPDSMNRPLLHGIVTYVHNLRDLDAQPEVQHALILSETFEGRCTGDVVVNSVEAAFTSFGAEVRSNLGLSSDSASYMGYVGNALATRAQARQRYIQIHDPSHLIHNLMTEIVDWKENEGDALPWMKSATNFMSDALTVSKLRELAGVFDRIQKYSRIRWLTIGRCARSVYDQWEEFSELPAGYAFTAASNVPASVTNLEQSLHDDTILQPKVHLLALLAEKWGPTLTWFESNNPRSYQCLERLQEFSALVRAWLSPADVDSLIADLDQHRGLNERVNVLRQPLQRLGAFVAEKWLSMLNNITDSQMRFWHQAVILNPSQKAQRNREDDFYFELFDHVAVRQGISAQDRRDRLRAEFHEYLSEPFTRLLSNSALVWEYWCSCRRRWPLLSIITLILLAAPIGNSELERSFSLVKRTSLDPHRQNASAENKSAMNRAHVNKDLKLYSLEPSA